MACDGSVVFKMMAKPWLRPPDLYDSAASAPTLTCSLTSSCVRAAGGGGGRAGSLQRLGQAGLGSVVLLGGDFGLVVELVELCLGLGDRGRLGGLTGDGGQEGGGDERCTGCRR